MENWAAELFVKMKKNNITQKDLSKKMGLTDKYVCMVINGKENPKNAQVRFTTALDELIQEKEEV